MKRLVSEVVDGYAPIQRIRFTGLEMDIDAGWHRLITYGEFFITKLFPVPSDIITTIRVNDIIGTKSRICTVFIYLFFRSITRIPSSVPIWCHCSVDVISTIEEKHLYPL
jgi:hypothetical protein